MTEKETVMISRREFLKYSGIASAGLAAPGLFKLINVLGAPALAATPPLAPWVDALPIPGVQTPVGTHNGAPLYEVAMKQVTQKLHRDLPATKCWGYGGLYPGNTFVAQTGKPIAVKWVNNLPTTHLLAASIDQTIMPAGMPDVRAVVHAHGGEVPPQFDGGPFSWFTPGKSRIYEYPNIQHAATTWYHDHAVGITRLNVFAGLAGFFIITDAVEASLNLPKAPYDMGLVFQDRTFTAAGQWDYPTVGNVPAVHPKWFPEFFGDTILVNGKITPFLRVEPRKYRWRLLNGSEARFYNIKFSSGQKFWVIGNEGGLLQEPVLVSQLLIAPGERYEIIVDFHGHNGDTMYVTNNAVSPFPVGGDPTIAPLPQLMQIRVNKPLQGTDKSSVPEFLRPVYRLPEGAAQNVRDAVLTEVADAADEPLGLLINGQGLFDPVTDRPRRGTIEIWRWINTTGDAHPMHTHLVMYFILDRRPFDVPLYMSTGQIVYTGPAVPPDPSEMGWKDTARMLPGMVTRTIKKFTSFLGGYVYHCHILEHEENDMMRPYDVLPSIYYFAEGTVRPNFDAYLTILNPDTDNDADVKITYMRGDGSTKTQTLKVESTTRATVNVKDVLGSEDDAEHDFSCKVETTNGVQVFAERPMYFNYKGKWTGGHCVVGALAPALNWYFAEGTVRPNFDTYLTIQNPSANQSAKVKITYMRGDGQTKVQNLTVPQHSRATVTVKDILGEGDDDEHDFSTKIESTNNIPIIAERPMYFNYKGIWTGGHDVVGALGPAPTWYFAEGTTRPDFDSYLCIQNPDQTKNSKVTITYYKGDGNIEEQNVTIPPHSRKTIVVKDKLGSANDAAHDFSCVVATTNGVNIIAERPMYFNYKGMWTGGHCVMGAVTPAKAWYFAEGTCRPNFDPYVTIMNPNATVDADVTIEYALGNGETESQKLTVPAGSRATVNVKDKLGSADDAAHDFSAKVASTNGVWIVAERPMYFNYNGQWTGGSCVMGFSD
jgi:spore coat protein A, manganese oxidase